MSYGEIMVILDACLNHSDIGINKELIISAGFCDLESCSCWGTSISLNVDARPTEDSKILRKMVKLY